jgi:hypothetical protein
MRRGVEAPSPVQASLTPGRARRILNGRPFRMVNRLSFRLLGVALPVGFVLTPGQFVL